MIIPMVRLFYQAYLSLSKIEILKFVKITFKYKSYELVFLKNMLTMPKKIKLPLTFPLLVQKK